MCVCNNNVCMRIYIYIYILKSGVSGKIRLAQGKQTEALQVVQTWLVLAEASWDREPEASKGGYVCMYSIPRQLYHVM